MQIQTEMPEIWTAANYNRSLPKVAQQQKQQQGLCEKYYFCSQIINLCIEVLNQVGCYGRYG